MRISVDEWDTGYENYMAILARGETVRVFLDGIEQKYCRSADQATGAVVRYKHDGNGNMVLSPCRQRVEMEVVCGKVTYQLEKDKK